MVSKVRSGFMSYKGYLNGQKAAAISGYVTAVPGCVWSVKATQGMSVAAILGSVYYSWPRIYNYVAVNLMTLKVSASDTQYKLEFETSCTSSFLCSPNNFKGQGRTWLQFCLSRPWLEGFQNYLAQMFASLKRCVMFMKQVSSRKVEVTLKGQRS